MRIERVWSAFFIMTTLFTYLSLKMTSVFGRNMHLRNMIKCNSNGVDVCDAVCDIFCVELQKCNMSAIHN